MIYNNFDVKMIKDLWHKNGLEREAIERLFLNRLSLLFRREGRSALVSQIVVVHTLTAADGTRPPLIQRVVVSRVGVGGERQQLYFLN